SAMASARTVSLTKPWWMARNAENAGGLQSAHRRGVDACSSALPPMPAGTGATGARGFVRSDAGAWGGGVGKCFPEALAETVQDRAQLRFAAVVARTVRGPVPGRDDESQRAVVLRGREQRFDLARPVRPGLLRVRLGIDDEADSALVEPVPVLAAA